MASAWDEQLLDYSFKKDPAGRLVFLPFGWKKPGYHIDSPSDEQKTKPFAKMYFLSRALVQFFGNLGAFLLAEAVISSDPRAPVGHKIKVFLVIYSIAVCLFEILPLWLLGRLYRKSIPQICSAMPVAGPEEISRLDKNLGPLRRRLIFTGIGFLALGVLLALAVIARR
jgi:hypothetical protein